MKKILKLVVITCVLILSIAPFSSLAEETDKAEQQNASGKETNVDAPSTENKEESTEPVLLAGNSDATSLVPDDNLRADINALLQKPSDYQPTEADLNNATGILNLTNKNYTTLNGLQYLKNVSTLQIVGITAPDADVAYIGQMSALTTLCVNSSSFETTSGLEPLRNLTSFDWSANGPDVVDDEAFTAEPRAKFDFSFVANNSNLTMLTFDLVYSTDPSYAFLSQLGNLTYISLTNSNMNNVAAIAGLSKLNYLNLNVNNIADLSPLKNHPIYTSTYATDQLIVLSEKEVTSGDSLTIDKPIQPDDSGIDYTFPTNPSMVLEGDKIVMSNITEGCIVDYKLYDYKTGEKDILSPGVSMNFTSEMLHFDGRIIQPITVNEPAADAAPVTVNYVDENGAKVAASETLTGKVDEPYQTTAKKVSGYKLTKTPTNVIGVFETKAQTVTYIYKKEAAVNPVDPTNPTKATDPSKSTEISVQVKAETPKNTNLPKTGDTKSNTPIFLFAGTLLIISGIVLLKRSPKAK